MKIINITKKTHAYILEDGTVVREVSEAHLEEYGKEKKTVFSAKATKTVDGVKVDTENFYVRVEDFVKRVSERASVTKKLDNLTSTRDLSTMTALELIALLK